MGTDEAAPVGAAESLRLIEAQRDAAVRSLSPDPQLIYWPWGLAWLIGFGLLFLGHDPHEQVRVNTPDKLPLVTLFALMIIAFLVSGLTGARANRQISGDSSIRGLRYGLSWLAGFSGNAVVCAHVSKFLSSTPRPGYASSRRSPCCARATRWLSPDPRNCSA
jgi:hypothetical protein